ncbi:hypothetical protein [Streptomyces sp. NPDC057702]|uniref:hypothetical protein n=1 Tax=unclassified Streptomyces TaxID=2593676 RepID=UPI0036B5630F
MRPPGRIAAPARAKAAGPRETVLPWRGDDLLLRCHATPTDTDAGPLPRLRAFRAEMLYAAGQRPAFRDPDGSFVDPQPLDFGAWHFTAHRDPAAPPAGYIRLAPPALSDHFQSRALIGPDQFAALLPALGVPGSATFEHSRLVVAEHARGVGLGALMNACAVAAARILGAVAMVGTVGFDGGHVTLQQRFGFSVCPGTERYSPLYRDHVCVVAQRTASAAEHPAPYEPLVDLVRQHLARALPDQGESAT